MTRRRSRGPGTAGTSPAHLPEAVPSRLAVPSRIAGLDALRGLAIVAMVAYHFAFDLRMFGVTGADFYHDPFWLGARTAILSTFLFVAGIGIVLSDRHDDLRRALRRAGVIALCALAVSVGSYLIFPASYIWFGVLHAIALSLLLARPLRRRPALAALSGLVVIAAGLAIAHPAFDNRALGWLGFMTAKPVTEDYVPLFPWTGAMLLGIAAGHALAARDFRPLAPLAALPGAFAWLGRHSLAVYMIHQPLLIGALWLLLRR